MDVEHDLLGIFLFDLYFWICLVEPHAGDRWRFYHAHRLQHFKHPAYANCTCALLQQRIQMRLENGLGSVNHNNASPGVIAGDIYQANATEAGETR